MMWDGFFFYEIIFGITMYAASLAAAAALTRPAALVTGSTDGIGVTTAKHLAVKGYDVLVHGRDASRIEKSKGLIQSYARDRATFPGRIWTLPPIDISTTHGAAGLAEEVRRLCQTEELNLSIVVNNAGVFAESHVITSEDLELTFAVNVVAPFVITSLLLPLLVKKSKSRIVVASSISQCRNIRDWSDMNYTKRPYSAHAAYSESKLLDAMLTMEIAKRLRDANLGTDRITCNCLDPGTVNTKMLLSGWGPCGIDVEDALDEAWLCTSDEVDNVTGRYFVYRSDRPASQSAYDSVERSRLWSLLSQLAPEAAAMWNFDFS